MGWKGWKGRVLRLKAAACDLINLNGEGKEEGARNIQDEEQEGGGKGR